MICQFPLNKQLFEQEDLEYLNINFVYIKFLKIIEQENFEMLDSTFETFCCIDDLKEKIHMLLSLEDEEYINYAKECEEFFIEQVTKIDSTPSLIKEKFHKISTLAMLMTSPSIEMNKESLKQENLDLLINSLVATGIEYHEIEEFDCVFQYLVDDHLIDLIQYRDDINKQDLLESVIEELYEDERSYAMAKDLSLIADMYFFVQDKTFSPKETIQISKTNIIKFKSIKTT